MNTAGQVCIGGVWMKVQSGFKLVPHVLKGPQLPKSTQSSRAQLIRTSKTESGNFH